MAAGTGVVSTPGARRRGRLEVSPQGLTSEAPSGVAATGVDVGGGGGGVAPASTWVEAAVVAVAPAVNVDVGGIAGVAVGGGGATVEWAARQ